MVRTFERYHFGDVDEDFELYDTHDFNSESAKRVDHLIDSKLNVDYEKILDGFDPATDPIDKVMYDLIMGTYDYKHGSYSNS